MSERSSSDREGRETQIPKLARSGRQPLLQVEGLSKLYPTTRGFFSKQEYNYAVNNVSFYVRHGETLGLVGESGCGKSTLGRTIIRLHEPTLGRIHFDGVDITRLSERSLHPFRRKMQLVFQDPFGSLNPRMTVRQIVGEGIEVFDLAPKAERDARVATMLEKVGLEASMMSRFPHEFSGGQRQRIGIARALAVEPRFVVCDEPVSALDVSVQAQIMNLLEELQDELSMSLLFISHDLRATSYMSHRVAVMYLGRIAEIGPTAAVQEKRYHPYTRALFNAIPGAASAVEGASSTAATPARRSLQGEPPSSIDQPTGCVFHTRCPKAEKGRCDVEAPPLEEIVPGSHHRVACWHPELE